MTQRLVLSTKLARFLLLLADLTQMDRLVFLVFQSNYDTDTTMESLLQQFKANLNHLVPKNASLVLACSGGPDSQVMLHLMGETLRDGAAYRVVAIGIDHGLRTEAPQELRLARNLAQKYRIAFHTLAVDLPNHGNTLQNAREARYAALREWGRAHLDRPRIMTAHSATDQCETLIQRLSRGTGLRGASAIHDAREDLVRPLLNATREDILKYAEYQGISFARDPSNANRSRTRTVIRDDIIPVLKTLNPEAERHWTQFADHAKRATLYLDQLAAPLRDKARGPLNSLKIQPLNEAPTFLRQWVMGLWLTENGLPVDSRYIAELEELSRKPDKKLSVAGKLVIHEAGSLWAPAPEPDFQQVFCAGDHLELAGLDGSLKTAIIEQKKTQFSPLIDPRQVAFDADQLHLGLEVRPWRLGDRFHPFGLQGSVKVGDLFTNLKIPKPMRGHWPLVVCGDVIIWVVGLRRGSSAPMSSETSKVLYMEYTGAFGAGVLPTSMELNSVESSAHTEE